MPVLSGGSSNRQTYNGKEAVGELGSNLYDFGARLYDARIGRWGVVDPLAENHYEQSPFNFVLNNPLLYGDAFGLDTVRANTQQTIHQGDVVKLDNGQCSPPVPPM